MVLVPQSCATVLLLYSFLCNSLFSWLSVRELKDRHAAAHHCGRLTTPARLLAHESSYAHTVLPHTQTEKTMTKVPTHTDETQLIISLCVGMRSPVRSSIPCHGIRSLSLIPHLRSSRINQPTHTFHYLYNVTHHRNRDGRYISICI